MKRFLALVLAFAMCVTLCTPVLAEEGSDSVLTAEESRTDFGDEDDVSSASAEPTEQEETTEPPINSLAFENSEEKQDVDPMSTGESGADSQTETSGENNDSVGSNSADSEDSGTKGKVEGNEDTASSPTDSEIPAEQEEPIDTLDTLEKENPKEEMPDPEESVLFGVRVSIHMGQNVPDTKFEVSLKNEESGSKTENVNMGSSANFLGLSGGEYTLTITGKNFAAHTQTVSVTDSDLTLDFYTGFLSGYKYEKNAKHPGALLYGDFDGDKQIDKERDTDALIALLEAKDNAVSLVDLDRLVHTLSNLEKDSIDVTAASRKTVIAKAASSVEGTKVDGKLDDFAAGKGSISLERDDGEPISEDNPVAIEFDLNRSIEGLVVYTPYEAPIAEGDVVITYTDENGEEQSITKAIPPNGINFQSNDNITVSRDATGAVVVNLGGQIAVKKITIRITKTQKNPKLAEITSVEFLNNMEDRIPEPAMDIPKNVKTTASSGEFTVTWKSCINVAGYELEVTDETGKSVIHSSTPNAYIVKKLDDSTKIENNKTYTVRVRSVNGDWRSTWSDSVSATPKPSKKPDAPDMVKASGAYRAIQVSWKKMKDTDSYNIYYREEGTEKYTKIEGITETAYLITNLGDQVTYELYVTGVNELGESGPSWLAKVKTVDINPATMPKYHLINKTPAGEEGAALVRVTSQQGNMINSALDTEKMSALGAADQNPASYLQVDTWDTGGYNAMGSVNGVVFEFDKEYTIQTFAIVEPVVQGSSYSWARVGWTDENGKETIESASISRRMDNEERVYYWIRLPKPVTTSRLRLGLARYGARGNITIAEACFYTYDSIEDDIFALYTDDLHTVLREDVTQETIDALRVRINTPDEENGEYHPDQKMLTTELDNAEGILKMGSSLVAPVVVHNTITTWDTSRGFGGLNAWQPLGVTAAGGETIVVYVGHSTKKTGENTNLQLIATQYHAEASGVANTVATLKVGRNEITIPKFSSIAAEAGGALYVQYTGRETDSGKYAVRVSGGVKVPTLDLYRIKDNGERMARAEDYIRALDEYVANIEATHNQVHMGENAPASVRYTYDAPNCILGASDILMETMLVSLPAQQILAGLGSGSVEARAQKLVNSMDAMEAMMDLFYQHKGLNPNAEKVADQYPRGHLNIRYQRMFAGAFMYASGNHIGIEWGSAPGVVTSVPVQSDNGKYVSGRYFGWGIAHEIGHCINQGAYAVAEVTNNYFSVLAQAKETNESVRFSYENVYKKVTSGEKGRASNVFTQLGLYWQLHLAYDNGYNYTTYADHAEQLKNLFFARVDSYARTPANAPKPGGVELSVSGGTDQALMRLACAAAEKNLLDFFTRWGMTPDEGTIQYASQFDEETRAIYYGTDASRVYRLTHAKSSLAADGTTEAVGADTKAAIVENEANTVELTLTSTLPAEEVLGYEIVRCTTWEGKVQRQPVGFVTNGTFRDTVTTLNHRVVFYEITVVDQFLNRSAVKTLAPLKIEHQGYIDKSGFTVTAANLTALSGDTVTDPVESEDPEEPTTPCEPQKEAAIRFAADQDSATVYSGTVGKNAAVTLEFNKTLAIEGFAYTSGGQNAIANYQILVRNENGEWATDPAAKGSFADIKDGIVYFGKNGNIASYTATAVRLEILDAPGAVINIAEIDVLGVTGDNVDWRRTDEGETAIGKLTADYQYDNADPSHVIPKDSIVFTGTYKGNPAYNVVLLYDQNGNIVGGTNESGEFQAQQIILAKVPDTGNLRDVSDGTWIYWIEPAHAADLSGITQVRAELYRVDNAMTNEGQRLVSDSMPTTMPVSLPPITLSGGAQ